MRRKIPAWVKVFLIIDMILLFVVLTSAAYIYLRYIFFSAQIVEVGVLPNFGVVNEKQSITGLIDPKSTGTPFQITLSNSGTQEVSTVNLPLIFQSKSLKSGVEKYYGEPSFNFHGIDFSNTRQRIVLTIYPDDDSVNNGEPIIIPFFPGRYCEFGKKTACVTAYKTNELGNVLLVSVHSGVGGEAQRLRNAIEGTGINQAKFDLEKVINKLDALNGSSVSILQDGKEITGLKLVATSRIPAKSIADYFNAPVTEALSLSAGIDPDILEYVDPFRPQLVIETCGWKMRGEPWAEEVTPTTASVYLGIIQEIP